MWSTQRPTHLVYSRFPDWPIRPYIFDKSCDRFSTNEKRSIPYAIFSQKIEWKRYLNVPFILSPVFLDLEYSRRERRACAQVRVRRQRRGFWIFETAWSFSRGFVLCLRAPFYRLYRTSFNGSAWPFRRPFYASVHCRCLCVLPTTSGDLIILPQRASVRIEFCAHRSWVWHYSSKSFLLPPSSKIFYFLLNSFKFKTITAQHLKYISPIIIGSNIWYRH